MTKQQTGLRIDRILYERFLKLCAVEKLRPGEAVEHLIQRAVDRGAVVDVYADDSKPEGVGRLLNETLFRSGLSRLKKSIELERRFLLETGEPIEEPATEELVQRLTELARRPISQELAKEFETVLVEADRLWEETEKSSVERSISHHDALGWAMEDEGDC